MGCIEFDGKNVELAARAASEELNIPIEKLKYDVISYGSTGIFGIVGAKKARIRVTVADERQECVLTPPNKETSEKKGKRRRPRRKPRSARKKPQEQNTEEESGLIPESGAQEEAVPEPGEGNSADWKDGDPDDPTADNGSDDFDDDTEETDEVSEEAPLDPELLEKAAEAGTDAISRIVGFINEDADIDVTKNGNRVLFNIKGKDAGVLIGKRGKTLSALQYIVDKIVNRQFEERIRVQVDVEDYFENRRANIRKLAMRMADKARKTRKPATLSRMNAHDRRIVHLTLKGEPDVRTQSVGDGFYRNLVIYPKKAGARKRKGQAGEND